MRAKPQTRKGKNWPLSLDGLMPFGCHLSADYLKYMPAVNSSQEPQYSAESCKLELIIAAAFETRELKLNHLKKARIKIETLKRIVRARK